MYFWPFHYCIAWPTLGQEIKFRSHPLETETSFSSSWGQSRKHKAFSSLNPFAVESRAFLAVLASPCKCVCLMDVAGPHLRFCEVLSFEDDICCSRKNSSASWIMHEEPCAQLGCAGAGGVPCPGWGGLGQWGWWGWGSWLSLPLSPAPGMGVSPPGTRSCSWWGPWQAELAGMWASWAGSMCLLAPGGACCLVCRISKFGYMELPFLIFLCKPRCWFCFVDVSSTQEEFGWGAQTMKVLSQIKYLSVTWAEEWVWFGLCCWRFCCLSQGTAFCFGFRSQHLSAHRGPLVLWYQIIWCHCPVFLPCVCEELCLCSAYGFKSLCLFWQSFLQV